MDGTAVEVKEISLIDWDLTFATNLCKFDRKKDSNYITTLHEQAVTLFSKCPLGDPIKPGQTLGQLFERFESNKLMSISAPCEGIVTVRDTRPSVSVGVGDGVAYNESLLRCDRVDIICMIAAVIFHSDNDPDPVVPGKLLSFSSYLFFSILIHYYLPFFINL